MRIHAYGQATAGVMPDQIVATCFFSTRQKTYQDALTQGSKAVTTFTQLVIDRTDFTKENFKTSRYSVVERSHIVEGENESLFGKGKIRKRIRDGFDFNQTITLTFDYSREKLTKLLAVTPGDDNAPHFNINFTLKDREAERNKLLPRAFDAAKQKAEAIATAAGLNLQNCEECFLEGHANNAASYDLEAPHIAKCATFRGDNPEEAYQNRLRSIDENFHPDTIIVSKEIDTIWQAN